MGPARSPHAKKVLVIARQGPRTFPERLDFLTSVGHGTGDRERRGMPGGGPETVITDLACYRFEEGEMTVSSLHPGVDLVQVRETLGWEPRIGSSVGTTTEPTAEELRLLREELDPDGLYL